MSKKVSKSNTIASGSQVIDNIYSYNNYREFLSDYFRVQKETKSYFSYRYFAKKAGFSAHSICSRIVSGERSLTYESIQKMIRGIGLEGISAEYFETLVNYNQTLDEGTKDICYEKINHLRKVVTQAKLNPKQFQYAEVWYYQIIRELAVRVNWGDDYKRLGNKVRPAITAAQAKEAVENMLEMGILLKRGSKLVLAENTINTETAPVTSKKICRDDIIKNGISAVKHLSPEERYVSFGAVPLSKESFEKAQNMLNNVAFEIMGLDEDREPDEIYHFVLQLFPSSQIKKG